MDFIKKISDLISDITGIEPEVIQKQIQVPPNTELGDYAFPCFLVAKKLDITPHEAAGKLSKEMKADFLKSSVGVGPYLNIKIDDSVFASEIISSTVRFEPKKEKIMVEFSQPNTHKEFHVGHLRNACLGDSIVRILQFTGDNVIPVNYIGDIGSHVAKTLWCLNNFHRGEVIKGNKGKYLGQLYVEANLKIEADEKLKDEVSKVLQDLEARKPEITKQWAITREWSLDEFKAIYKDLGIKFTKYYFESEEEEKGKEAAQELLQKGLAKKSEGAVIMDLEEYKLGVAIILKSDGTSIYMTKDLSLFQSKYHDFKMDRSIHVIDSRQSMYLAQLFKILGLMGFKTKMVHVSYEFVSTTEGPISSRKGNAYLYEDLKERLVKKTIEETKKRHGDWNDDKILDVANKITLSALKFGMLRIENNREIVFDENKWLDFEGETGPYILYTYARLNSIAKKASKTSDTINWGKLSELEDKNLLKLIENEKGVISEASKNYKPSLIARYLLELCQKTNEYYHKHHVLKEKEEVRDARLKLFEKIREIIKRNLSLLGIGALEEM